MSIAAVGSLRDVAAATPMAPEPMDAEAPALWTHSSGTSGHPKAVVHVHRFAREVERVGVELFGITAADRLFASSKLFFAYPQTNCLYTGLKVGAAMAATAAVVAEFVGSDAGLGYLILEYNGFIETAKVFAAIILLSLVGLAIYYLVEAVERLAIPWHVSQAKADATGPN